MQHAATSTTSYSLLPARPETSVDKSLCSSHKSRTPVEQSLPQIISRKGRHAPRFCSYVALRSSTSHLTSIPCSSARVFSSRSLPSAPLRISPAYKIKEHQRQPTGHRPILPILVLMYSVASIPSLSQVTALFSLNLTLQNFLFLCSHCTISRFFVAPWLSVGTTSLAILHPSTFPDACRSQRIAVYSLNQ